MILPWNASSGSAELGSKRKERDNARSLDRARKSSLMPCAIPRDSSGKYFASLASVLLEDGNVLIINCSYLVDAEIANFSLRFSHSCAAFTSHHSNLNPFMIWRQDAACVSLLLYHSAGPFTRAQVVPPPRFFRRADRRSSQSRGPVPQSPCRPEGDRGGRGHPPGRSWD